MGLLRKKLIKCINRTLRDTAKTTILYRSILTVINKPIATKIIVSVLRYPFVINMSFRRLYCFIIL